MFDRTRSSYRGCVTNDNIVNAFEHRTRTTFYDVVSVVVVELMNSEGELRQCDQ